ncbi:hypothetical protein YC2023_037116 [Brassica napus]
MGIYRRTVVVGIYRRTYPSEFTDGHIRRSLPTNLVRRNAPRNTLRRKCLRNVLRRRTIEDSLLRISTATASNAFFRHLATPPDSSAHLRSIPKCIHMPFQCPLPDIKTYSYAL